MKDYYLILLDSLLKEEQRVHLPFLLALEQSLLLLFELQISLAFFDGLLVIVVCDL